MRDETYDVDGYEAFVSTNEGIDNSCAVMKLECVGYTDITIHIRSNAELGCDYTIASIANASTYPTSYDDSNAKASTQELPESMDPGEYTAVEYTGLTDNSIIYISFVKDSSSSSGDDRGYVLIPKQS